jgi:Ca-activated chloride channel family protein
MRKVLFPVLVLFLFSLGANAQNITQGELGALTKSGKPLGSCPLKHTDVQAEISGFLSRVHVTQEFENNFSEKIEAVYVFPLPQNAAVDDMSMRIGERIVRGKIMKRDEARQVYEAAMSNGQVASLLDQERPNIFTQSVANILPGEKVTIEISYVETLKYEDGAYEFVFPMVVAPRYIPGSSIGQSGTGFSSDTNKVPDGSRITPHVAKERAGHDISIQVKLDAGIPIDSVNSKSHEIESTMLTAASYVVKLKDEATIPNKDFILRYDVAGKRIEDAVLTHRDERGGYFTLILQPPDTFRPQDVTPKEIVFVLDTSGSMSGFPIEKAKEAMKMALDGLNPQDTFNLITFAGDTAILFEKPVPATPQNLKKAQDFLAGRSGSGGTEMMKAISAALDPSDSKDHIRVVCFMTDGEVGNDNEIIADVQKHPNVRVFSFGIGSSVNRYLLEKIAEEGRGEAEFVSLSDDGSAAAKRFHERVRSPLLTDISVDFGGLQVADVYPRRIGDLFSAKPVIIHGRYTKSGSGVIKLKGRTSTGEFVRDIPVNFPETDANHDVLATLWARTKIDDLTSQDYQNAKQETRDAITNIGLDYRLMTQFTSFVAVEEQVVTDGGQPRRIEVPVELPAGMNYDGVFGAGDAIERPTGSQATPSQTSFGNFANMPVGAYSTAPNGYIIQTMAGRRKQKAAEVINSPPNVTNLALTKDVGGVSVPAADDEVMRVDANIAVLKVVNAPKPSYPAKTNATGEVDVQIYLDQNGKITGAEMISGDASLRQEVETAAKTTTFEPLKPNSDIMKIMGILSYGFARDKTVSTPTFLQIVRIEKKSDKYHSSINALVDRLKAGNTNPTPDEAKFVHDGKAEVVVRLTELKPETIEEMKRLGFEVLTQVVSANAVVGRIPVEKIAVLRDIDAVTFISPQNR